MSLNVNAVKERSWPFDRPSPVTLSGPSAAAAAAAQQQPPSHSHHLQAIGNYQRRLIAATENNRERRRMENSTYVPTVLQSPGLMVLSSESSTDSSSHQQQAQHPGAGAGSQAFGHDAGPKDIHVPFTSAASFTAGLPHVPPSLYGHVPDSFANLSAAHLLHMHAPFLAPNMDRALSFINSTGGGAFRPVTSAGFHSAFVSAAKCPKLDHGALHHAQQLRGLSHSAAAHSMRSLHQHQQQQQQQQHNPFGPNLKLTSGGMLCASGSGGGGGAFGEGANGGGGPRGAAGSPLQVKDEGSSDSSEFGDRLTGTPCSDLTDGTERSTPDDNRDKRKKTSLFAGQSPCCPVCGVTIRCGEFEVHFIQEIEKLSKISRLVRRTPRDSSHKESTPSRGVCSSSSSSSTSSNGSNINNNNNSNNNNNNNINKKLKDSPQGGGGAGEKITTPESRWESYQRVRNNRQNRLGARSKLKKRRLAADEAICPVCCERVSGSPEELNAHAEHCLRKRDLGADEDEAVDVEGESYEEYEWAGQTRIRASSLLEGGYAASGFHTSSSRNQKAAAEEEEDVDLNVDGDDSATYGQAQYGEADVIPCSCDEPGEDEERQALRGVLLTGSSTSQAIKVESDAWSERYSGSPLESENDNRISSSGEAYAAEPSTTGTEHVIEALKSRLREVESAHAQVHTTQQQPVHDFGLARNKCRICMETYEVPVVSVSCWHVYCEGCWLRALGVKKLCPQCNMITSPADLRKLYL